MRIKLADVCNELRRVSGGLLRSILIITTFQALALLLSIYVNLSKSLVLEPVFASFKLEC